MEALCASLPAASARPTRRAAASRRCARAAAAAEGVAEAFGDEGVRDTSAAHCGAGVEAASALEGSPPLLFGRLASPAPPAGGGRACSPRRGAPSAWPRSVCRPHATSCGRGRDKSPSATSRRAAAAGCPLTRPSPPQIVEGYPALTGSPVRAQLRPMLLLLARHPPLTRASSSAPCPAHAASGHRELPGAPEELEARARARCVAAGSLCAPCTPPRV